MIKKPLFLDVVNEAWIDDPTPEESIHLVKVYDINFSTLTKIKAKDTGDFAGTPDEASREEAEENGDPRASEKQTYLLVHAYYEYDNQYGAIAKTADTLISTITTQDDGKGNIINTEFTPNTLPDKDDILNLIKESIIDTINSEAIAVTEKAYIEKVLHQMNEEFDNLV